MELMLFCIFMAMAFFCLLVIGIEKFIDFTCRKSKVFRDKLAQLENGFGVCDDE